MVDLGGNKQQQCVFKYNENFGFVLDSCFFVYSSPSLLFVYFLPIGVDDETYVQSDVHIPDLENIVKKYKGMLYEYVIFS